MWIFYQKILEVAITFNTDKFNLFNTDRFIQLPKAVKI